MAFNQDVLLHLSLVVIVLLIAGPVKGDERQAPIVGTVDCNYGIDDVGVAPGFGDYPTPVRSPIRPVRPVLNSQDARVFRTRLRDAAASGPNFAGHYTVAVWGCGSSCNDFALIDARSGRVFFDEELRGISGVHVVERGKEPLYNSLRFRLDSRLLIILGAPKDDESRDGVAYYEWTGAAFKLIRFIPRTQVCAVSH